MTKRILMLMTVALSATVFSETAEPERKSLNVLMVGNSYSICCLKEMPKVAKDLGLKLNLYSLYIGGCSLERHAENFRRMDERDFRPYLLNRSLDGAVDKSGIKVTIPDAFSREKWDIVTVQQASHESWKPERYEPYLGEVVAAIRKLAPGARVVMQETWSYASWAPRLASWGFGRDEMYARLHAVYGASARKYGFDVIPMGTAVQRYRERLPVREPCTKDDSDDPVGTSRGDSIHLNPTGEYLQGLVWTARLFGADVTRCKYRPKGLPDTKAELMRRIATEVAGRMDVVLAADGRAKAAVVLAADATESERFAAAELSAYVGKLTGAKLPVGPAADAGLVPITFRRLERGETASGVKDDGCRIDVSKDGIVIASQHPAGILFGVYHILNRFGGVEWFHAESGDDYEPIAALKIPEGTILRNPMPQRNGMPSGNGIAATPEIRRKCALWNVRNGFNLNQRNPGADPAKVTPGNDYDNRTVRELGHVDHAEAGGHVLGNLVLDTPIDPKELKAECERVRTEESARFDKPQGEVVTRYAQWRILVRTHPEWFGLVDGQRVPCGVSLRDELGFHGKSSMPCLSNPGTRAAMLANFRRWRARYPKGIPVYYRICCDDQSRWCECDACMRLLKCKGPSDDKDKASDYWWDFINWFSGEVLKDDPDLSLGVYVYRTYQTFPKKVKPVVRDRMSIVLCPHGRCYTHTLNDPKCPINGKYRDMFRIWADAGFPINAFEYMNQTPGKCNYAFWERVWIEDLKWYMSRGVSHGAGGLVGPWCGYAADESYFRRNAAKARWQFGWLSGKFEWDPTLDFDTVRDEMLRRYYRAAAKPMTAYHKLLEKAFLGTGICMPYGGGGSLFAAAAATPGVMTEATRLLEEATALAGDDRELLKRLAWDREYFRTNWESAGISAAGHAVTPMARTVDPVTVDGRLDEKTWIAAQPMDDFRHVVTIRDTPRKPEEAYDPPAKLRTAWDDANLYLAFTCAKADGKVVDAADDGSTFVAMRGTHVEFMVTAPALKGRYYHAAISHAGRAYSALTENGKMRDLTKKLPMKFAVADAPDAWTVEVAIPLAAFGGAKEGDLWKIDASVASADKKGKIRGYGSLCGYGLHLPDYWPIVSFGRASDLFRNGGFETLGAPPPKGEGGKFLNGRNWTFLSDRVPTEWFYQQNGGTAEAVKGDAAEGETYLRLTPPAKGSPLFLLQELNAYPASATKLTMSFFARGKGEVKAVSLHSRPGEKQLVSQPVRLDSAEWKRHSVELPLEGGHPYKMMFRLQSFGNPVDVDGIELK